MTPATQGFAWEGFFRALQGDIMSLAGWLLFVLVVYLVSRWSIGKLQHGDGSAGSTKSLRAASNGIALVLTFVIVIGFVWRATSVVSVNRMPRADLDKSAVYQQMDSNIQKH